MNRVNYKMSCYLFYEKFLILFEKYLTKMSNKLSLLLEKVKKHDWKANPDAVKLLKRPAACVRPKFAKTPTHHAGGRIYFSKAKHAFRVYSRRKDRVEETVDFQDDERSAFRYSCALIEADPRPIV